MQSNDTFSIGFDYSEARRGLAFGFQATERLNIALAFPTYVTSGGRIGDDHLTVSYQLLQETDHMPAVTLGVSGLGGDTAASCEYIAATKSVGDFTASIGLGWGQLAGVTTGPGADAGSFRTDDLF